MTREEFNEKWKHRLEKGFYGCQINNEVVINYIDNIFEQYAQEHPEFTFSQIKSKFGRLVVYVEGVPEFNSEGMFDDIRL